MLEKDYDISRTILKCEALLRRINPNHPTRPDVTEKLRTKKAGEKGERSLEFHLSMLSDSRYHIFNGLRLKLGKYFFQIDTFILSPSFGFSLESKNRSGEITYKKDFNQVFCKKNGVEERIKNPILQARLQINKLQKWLKEHNCPDVPLQYFVVNTNEKTIIRLESRDDRIVHHLCNSECLMDKIEQLAGYYKTDKLSDKDIKKIKRLLLTNHTPEDPDILQMFHITPMDVLTGVQCPECFFLAMVYKNGIWCCPKCEAKSKTAHIQAIHDYFLLIKPTITNSELRAFLHLNSIHVARKILKSMNLPYTGKFKDRVYHQPSYIFSNK